MIPVLPDHAAVLDKGYVLLHDKMGTDLTPVNAARASYNKKSEYEYRNGEIDEQPTDDGGWERVRSHGGDWAEWRRIKPRDQKLLTFLADGEHTSPFRHAMLQFEVYAPLMVARQHWKYRVGSAFEEPDDDCLDGWNESSRRYVTEEPEFYIPSVWRSKPENSKQGSGEPVDEKLAAEYTAKLKELIQDGEETYGYALKDGLAPEQARGLLGAVYNMYVRYYWTASLSSVIHFLSQRLEHDAQYEIQQYAQAVHTLSYPHFPKSFDAFGLSIK